MLVLGSRRNLSLLFVSYLVYSTAAALLGRDPTETLSPRPICLPCVSVVPTLTNIQPTGTKRLRHPRCKPWEKATLLRPLCLPSLCPVRVGRREVGSGDRLPIGRPPPVTWSLAGRSLEISCTGHRFTTDPMHSPEGGGEAHHRHRGETGIGKQLRIWNECVMYRER